MDSIQITAPFEAHVHLRDGPMLQAVGPLTARQFWGGICEPNLVPPITTRELGQDYLERVRTACGPDFTPYLLCYLTDTLDPQALLAALLDDTFIGVKFYPYGATTNSDSGVIDVTTLYTHGTTQFDCLRSIAIAGKVLQLHCELNFSHAKDELDTYDKEAYFFREVLPRILEKHPDLKVSCEHITCRQAVQFMERNRKNDRLGCSITAHHLLLDRRDMFRGGLRPHLYCLPVIKREEHREALLDLATSGHYFSVWAGTDSAPHDRRRKETECCSGGIFTAHGAVELYAEIFDEMGSLDCSAFEQFMSLAAPKFYGLKSSNEQLLLTRTDWTCNDLIPYSSDPADIIRPFGYDEKPEDRHVFRWKAERVL